ncbi:GGDEF domain-containing protein [Alteromonas gilva]|uniref:diguanylate cyclase n=1 Tax=Alteromonas gilva TaxID=2987522 RepID=A0ABT5L4P1_9ALTE|nr:GGDEF domain-containing protein [Alteromonas gilva]MDC8832004.1 GGDEF domain-containing protein [Alteromonas gilva]
MFDRIFDGSLMPHGHCLLWRGDLLFLHLAGDISTVLAYALIPVGIFYFIHKRKDIEFSWLALLFACFIAFCGASHLIGILNIWHGYYFIEGVIKLLTGIISIVTAIFLWRLMPSFIRIPSIEMLQERNAQLEAVRSELEEVNKTLEEKVKQRTLELERQANTDTVTGIASRYAIIERLQQCYSSFERYRRPFSILMVDIDHFKQVNDTHGHQVGDDVLHELAQCIFNNIRGSDTVGRYGGEEFLVLLPESNAAKSLELAERIRSEIEQLHMVNDIHVTASVGVSTITEGISCDVLISQADKALYAAKKLGRNGVIAYHEDLPNLT